MSISGIAASNEALTVTDRRLSPPPRISLHHKGSGLRLAASATADGLAA